MQIYLLLIEIMLDWNIYDPYNAIALIQWENNIDIRRGRGHAINKNFMWRTMVLIYLSWGSVGFSIINCLDLFFDFFYVFIFDVFFFVSIFILVLFFLLCYFYFFYSIWIVFVVVLCSFFLCSFFFRLFFLFNY